MFSIASPHNNFARMNQTQRETKDWLKAMASHLGLSMSQLARNAGMAASTLTRYVNDETDTLTIQQSSLEAVANFTGFRPYQFPGRSRPGFNEPDAIPFELDDRVPAPWVRSAVLEARSGRNGIEAWVMKGAALDAMGILPGDVIIVDQNLKPKPGDVVVAQIVDYGRGSAETVIRVYQPPYICSHSVRLGPMRPEQVDEDRVSIAGTAIGFLRTRH